MKRVKKAFRLIGLSLLILLASLGVGLSGGIALPVSRKREDSPINIELVEDGQEKSEVSLKEEE